ncbi:MAG: RNase P modulator RnpM [Anaerolineae bacterium]
MTKRARKKHIPLRTCVGCRDSKPKRDLTRVVRLIDDGVIVDETGKRNGRGAYLCKQRSCWVRALDRGTLGRALRAQISPEDVAALRAYAESLPDSTEEEAA